MSEFQIDYPDDGLADSLADWAEALVLLEHRSFASTSYVRDRLRDRVLDDDWDELDTRVALLLGEIDRRRRIAPNFYPFERDRQRDGFGLRSGVPVAPYEYLLWLSISPAFRTQNRAGETETKFNSLVRQAISGYLGQGSRAIEVSARANSGRGNLHRRIESIAAELNLPSGGWSSPRPQRQDGGVDVIGWRPFADRRSAFLVVLCQCTVTKEWTTKASDVKPPLWSQWIKFIRPPLVALAVPFSVPMGFEKWDEVQCDADLIFDRLRIGEHALARNVELSKDMELWSSHERSLLEP